MNLSKLQNYKEILDVSKEVLNKYKGGQHGSSGPNNSHPSHYSYGPYGYGAGPSQCQGHCMSGGGSKSKGPMQILSTLKNSKFKSLPQNLQSLAALKRGGGLGGGGGVKKILPQVLKGIKSKM